MDIILEKKQDDKRLHLLRIIKLLEADLNFILVLIFRKILVNFSEKYFTMN